MQHTSAPGPMPAVNLRPWATVCGAAFCGAALAVTLAGCSASGPAAAPKTFADDDEPQAIVAAAAPAPAASQADDSAVDQQLAGVVRTVAAQKPALLQPALLQALRAPGEPAAPVAVDAGGPAPAASHNWDLQFPKGDTLESYARQLDFFGIELGLLMPGNKIIYAFSLSRLKPDVRTGPADAEGRFYFSWKRGDLVEADHQLYRFAGVATEGRVILHFLPAEIEGVMAELEKSHAGDQAAAVVSTRFGIRRKHTGFELVVLEQTYK